MRTLAGPLVLAASLAVPQMAQAQRATDTLGGPSSFMMTAPMRLALQNNIIPLAGGFAGAIRWAAFHSLSIVSSR